MIESCEPDDRSGKRPDLVDMDQEILTVLDDAATSQAFNVQLIDYH